MYFLVTPYTKMDFIIIPSSTEILNAINYKFELTFFPPNVTFLNSTYEPECDRNIEKTVQKIINASPNSR